MRLPARCAIERTTVSTSGSSGMRLRNINPDFVAADLDGIGGELQLGIEVVCSGVAIELPEVPRADQAPAADHAVPERTAAMRADSLDRSNPARRVADCDDAAGG